jgi:hypothetical protein
MRGEPYQYKFPLPDIFPYIFGDEVLLIEESRQLETCTNCLVCLSSPSRMKNNTLMVAIALGFLHYAHRTRAPACPLPLAQLRDLKSTYSLFRTPLE